MQGPSARHRAEGFDRWEDDPTVTEHTLDTPGAWRLLDHGTAGAEVRVSGRLVGGCVETVHVPPHLALVTGAVTEVTVTGAGATLVQALR